MKIAVLSSHTPSLFWFRMDMMKAFSEKGYEVIAVGNEPEADWAEKFKACGVRYLSATISRNGTNPLNDLKTLRSLLAILKAEKPERIFAYQAKTVIYGCLAAKLAGIREIYALIAGVGSVFLSDSVKTKVIRSILVAEYRLALKQAKKVFFQNGDDVSIFEKHHIISKDDIVMIPGSGVSLDRFVRQLLPAKPAFLCIGRLIKDKGIMEYLEAAKVVKADYPDIRFMLVGPYDTNPSAITREELAAYTESGIVEYFGEQADVIPYLKQASVFVLPSYHEGTPKTVLEAMASGRAIITTDAPGCRETVKDGINGYLVPVRDSMAVANKMTELICHPETIGTMADNGRKMVEEKFDVKIVNRIICETMKI